MGYGMSFTDGFDAWIEDNDINGTVELQVNGTYKPLAWEAAGAARPVRDKISEEKSKLLIQKPGTFHIHGNFLNNVAMNGGLIMEPKPQQVYASVIVSENIFRNTRNSFVAISLNIINNQFLGTKKGDMAAFVMGMSGIIMSNIEMARNGALVDTIFVNPVIDPKLNLIDVA